MVLVRYLHLNNVLLIKRIPFLFSDRSATICRWSPYLTQLDGKGMTEFEEQQCSDMIERQNEDMIMQIASSSEYTAQALIAMQPLRPCYFNIFDAHNDNNSNFNEAEYELNSMEQPAVRSQLSRICTVNESVKESLHA